MTESFAPAPPQSAPVIDIFSRKVIQPGYDNHIVRISPEYDGLGMLYRNDSQSSKLFTLKIIGWGLQADGEVVGLVPWLNQLTPCTALTDPLNGHWEGYYNTSNNDVFYEAPEHKFLELSLAQAYYSDSKSEDTIIQEIPDTIGTHAVLSEDGENFDIKEVFSWRLLEDGLIQGMLIDKDKIQHTPILAGDECLYPANADHNFKYYFQYRIANKIKERDPDALEAMAFLMGSK